MSERKRSEAARQRCIDAIRAYLDGEDADVYNLLDAASTEDPLGTSQRLTRIAASAVEELAAIRHEATSTVLAGLLEPAPSTPAAPTEPRFTRDELLWINNALAAILSGPQAIESWEFDTLIGGSADDVRTLLRTVNERVSELRRADPEW